MILNQQHEKVYETEAEAAACRSVVEPVLKARVLRDLRTRCDDKRLEFADEAVVIAPATVEPVTDGYSVFVVGSITAGPAAKT